MAIQYVDTISWPLRNVMYLTRWSTTRFWKYRSIDISLRISGGTTHLVHKYQSWAVNSFPFLPSRISKLYLEIETFKVSSISIILWRFHFVCLLVNYRYWSQIEFDVLFLAVGRKDMNRRTCVAFNKRDGVDFLKMVFHTVNLYFCCFDFVDGEISKNVSTWMWRLNCNTESPSRISWKTKSANAKKARGILFFNQISIIKQSLINNCE